MKRFDRYAYFSKQDKDVIAAFLSLFPWRHNYIYRYPTDGHWSTATKFSLSDTDILKSICGQTDRIVGTRFAWDSRLAILDIDTGGRYHTRKAIKGIQKALKSAGITRSVVYQSSNSGGYHVYITFNRPLKSAQLNWGLTQTLLDAGFKPEPGHLEVYPPADVNSQAVRLPLQYGFAFLDQKTLDVLHERDRLSPSAALDLFANDLELTNSADRFTAQCSMLEAIIEFSKTPDHDDPYSNCVQSYAKPVQPPTPTPPASIPISGGKCSGRFELGRGYFEGGLTAVGQRHEALLAVGYYLFFGDREAGIEPLGYGRERERLEALQRWLAEKHNGFSEDVNARRRHAFAQIEDMVYWTPKEHTPGVEKRVVPDSWVEWNQKCADKVKAKILQWVEQLKDVGVRSMRELSRLSGIAQNTLRKYKELWCELLAVETDGCAANGKTCGFSDKSEPETQEESGVQPMSDPSDVVSGLTRLRLIYEPLRSKLRRKVSFMSHYVSRSRVLYNTS